MISLKAFSTASDSSSSESAMVTISAFSPNAIGSSFASLKTPDLKVFVVSSNFVLSSSRFVSTLSGIILNWIPAVAMISFFLEKRNFSQVEKLAFQNFVLI